MLAATHFGVFLMSPIGWEALAAWVAVVIAAGAGWYGRGQLIEAKQLREEQAQPYVVVFPDDAGVDPRHFDLVIKNFGTTAATDVEVKFSSEIRSAVLQRAIKTPQRIPVLVPGQEWRTFWEFTPQLDAALKDKNSRIPSSYTATVTFRDSRGMKSYGPYLFEIDWNVLIDRGFVTVYRMHDAARALAEIKDQIRKWTDSSGLRVIAWDGDKRDQRQMDYDNAQEGERSREAEPQGDATG
jgi:hypothetical protein